MIKRFSAGQWSLVVGLAALASLPTALLEAQQGWGLLDPSGYVCELIWLPVTLYCQLKLLMLFGKALNSNARTVKLDTRTIGAAFGVEFLLSLRLAAVGLGCLLPALLFVSLFGLEAVWARVVSALLGLAGLIPATLWLLRRIFATPIVLWQGLSAGQALDESSRLSRSKLGSVLWPMLWVNGLALVLEGLCGDSMALSLVFLPLSIILSTAVLAYAYRILTL